MKNTLKNLILAIFLLLFTKSAAIADATYFIDFSKLLNFSNAGAEAQKKLKNMLESENKRFIDQEKDLKKLETELITQKKIISNEDYQKKLEDLRKKVAKIQKDKEDSLKNIAQSRNKARQELMKNINPILKKYMDQNNIRIIIDKQNVILGDSSLEITDKIIEILNKELKSISLN